MNIAQVTRGAVMGGGERHILGLLKGFRGRPVHMTLVVFDKGPLAAAARELGVEVHLIPKRYRGDVAPVAGLVRFIKRRDIDVLHTHLISGNLYGRLASRLAGCRVVSTQHHSVKEAMGPRVSPFMQHAFFTLDTRTTFLCDRVVTPSRDLKQQMVAQGVKEKRIAVVPNGIDLEEVESSERDALACREEFGVPRDTKLVGMVGRMVALKNFELLLRSAKSVLGSGARARFVLVGDGPDRRRLEEIAAALGLQEHVVFTGFREDVLRVVSALDLFVLASRSETFPLALIEAMALGKPVIAARVGGVPEIIEDHDDGLLFPSDDQDALSEAMRDLLSNEGKAQALGSRARRKANADFSLAVMADRLTNLYREITTG